MKTENLLVTTLDRFLIYFKNYKDNINYADAGGWTRR